MHGVNLKQSDTLNYSFWVFTFNGVVNLTIPFDIWILTKCWGSILALFDSRKGKEFILSRSSKAFKFSFFLFPVLFCLFINPSDRLWNVTFQHLQTQENHLTCKVFETWSQFFLMSQFDSIDVCLNLNQPNMNVRSKQFLTEQLILINMQIPN